MPATLVVSSRQEPTPMQAPSAVVPAHTAVKAAGDKARDFKLLIGSEFATTEQVHLVLLAKNRLGYGKICALITDSRRHADKGSYRLSAAGGVQLHDPPTGCGH
jgi:error-prone DNA polymerase